MVEIHSTSGNNWKRRSVEWVLHGESRSVAEGRREQAAETKGGGKV
jgi:hypothetical protein